MQSVGVPKRRKRSINFTESDRQMLMNLVRPHLRVIENKRLDKFSSKLKSETWENIKIQYNHLNSEPRTALQLKHFYETIKYRMRRMNNAENQSDALVEVQSNQSEEYKMEDPKPKIKCVNIEKLKNTKQLETPDTHSVPTDVNAPPAHRITDVRNALNQKEHTMQLNIICNGTKNTSNAAVSTAPTSSSSLLDSAIKRQNELHAMRIKMLEDERLFRQQEHLKHMEYCNIVIMAMKASLLNQSQSHNTDE